MHREYYEFHSKILNKKMELLRFGNFGPSIIWVPTSCGRFFDVEDQGAISILEPLINQGLFQIFSIGSIDKEHLYKEHFYFPSNVYPRLLDYYQHVVTELVPWIQQTIGSHERITWCGASLGAFHAANLSFYAPIFTERVIGLGGAYRFTSWGSAHDPMNYLQECKNNQWFPTNLSKHIEHICAVGQDDHLLNSNKEMHQSLQELNMKSTLMICEGGHDWPTWKKLIKEIFYGNQK